MTAAAAWRCTVCGYVHRGDEPPDTCPVCGAAADAFEPAEEAPAAAPKTDGARVWRCRVCGYEHEGPEPPETCPVCGAGAEDFEPVDADDGEVSEDAPDRLVIVGGGIAGVSAAEAARKAAPDTKIVLLTDEKDSPYFRINLTRLLAGEVKADDLALHPESWYEAHRIERIEGTAEAVDPESGVVRLADGGTVAFDRLVLACGGVAFVPPIPGADGDGVMTLRTLRDALRIQAASRRGRRFVVIGGGILGLETAGALVRQGVAVTLLEGHATLMPRQLPAPGAEVMAGFVRGLGVDLRTEARTRAIEPGADGLAVRLEDGDAVEADGVVIAAGIRSHTKLAEEAGLDVQTGIVVDDHLRTSHARVWAAGDAAEHKGVLYGSWVAAQYQGQMAGMNAAGVATEFGGLPRAHTLKVLGLDMVSIGRFEPEDDSDRVLDGGEGEPFQRFVFREGRMVGAVLLGDTRAGAGAAKAIESGRNVAAWIADGASTASVVKRLLE